MAIIRRQIDNFVIMLDGYVEQDKNHLNVNVFTRETLLDAQKHPENYPQLTVRILYGYAVNFIKLTKEQAETRYFTYIPRRYVINKVQTLRSNRTNSCLHENLSGFALTK